MDDANRLAMLLEQERNAALSADVETLEALQEAKEALLAEVSARGSVDKVAYQRLAGTARSNLALLRQLVVFQRALLGLQEKGAGYGATGRPAAPKEPLITRRGVL